MRHDELERLKRHRVVDAVDARGSAAGVATA